MAIVLMMMITLLVLLKADYDNYCDTKNWEQIAKYK